jgi:pyruvate dehydrogenase E1 component beta subunit
VQPQCIADGRDLTIVGSGYSTRLALDARARLADEGFHVEVVDLRVINPFQPGPVLESVSRTRHLLVIDGGWRTCGVSAEVLACVAERAGVDTLRRPPVRITLPDAPAPTSRALEQIYYPSVETVVASARQLLTKEAAVAV